MNNKKKKYVGSFVLEKEAAILYDKVAILTHALKVIHFYKIDILKYLFRQKQIFLILNQNLLKYSKKTLILIELFSN